MTTETIVLYPKAVFTPHHINVVVCASIITPRIFPKNIALNAYVTHNGIKNVVIQGEEHLNRPLGQEARNDHGFIYTGDRLLPEDLAGFPLISNLAYADALQIVLRELLAETLDRETRADILQAMFRVLAPKDSAPRGSAMQAEKPLSPVAS